MIDVVIADDHPLMLEGLNEVLNKIEDIQIVGEASRGIDVNNKVSECDPDILIMDVTMPTKSGIDLLKDLTVIKPNLPVLILSIHAPHRFAIRCLRAGASGYLNKSAISDELVDAIYTICKEKKKYITDQVAELLHQQINGDEKPLHESLSDREFEILCLLAKGDDVKDISKKLSLSPNTIHTYRSRIKKKLQLSSTVEMTRCAYQNEWVG